MDWYFPWPADALLSVAAKHAPAFELQDCPRLVSQSLIDYFAQASHPPRGAGGSERRIADRGIESRGDR